MAPVHPRPGRGQGVGAGLRPATSDKVRKLLALDSGLRRYDVMGTHAPDWPSQTTNMFCAYVGESPTSRGEGLPDASGQRRPLGG